MIIGRTPYRCGARRSGVERSTPSGRDAGLDYWQFSSLRAPGRDVAAFYRRTTTPKPSASVGVFMRLHFTPVPRSCFVMQACHTRTNCSDKTGIASDRPPARRVRIYCTSRTLDSKSKLYNSNTPLIIKYRTVFGPVEEAKKSEH